MNHGKKKVILALLVGLVATVAVSLLLSILGARAPTQISDHFADSGPVALQGYQSVAAFQINAEPAIPLSDTATGDDAEACTIAVATGISTTMDGRPMLWKNRDYFGRPEAWQAMLFWHQATGQQLSASYTVTDRFNYVAVSDRGDRRDPPDITETLYYPWMGANEKGLGLVQAQAHTLVSETQIAKVGDYSQDPNGIGNGGLNHWILSRCETITDVQQLLADTNGGGGYNGSTARNTASLLAVIDRFGGAAIFEVDGNSFTRQNITKEFAPLDERPNSSGPPVDGYTGFDYRSNFSRITFTNTKIGIGFPYFPDVCTNTVTNSQVITTCNEIGDGINDLETSTSSVKRWERVYERMNDAPKDYQYFAQKWLRKDGHPREFYLETVARSVGYAPYLSTRVNSVLTSTHNWKQQKPTGWHLNRFVTVSSAVIVGSKPGDQDEGRLTTLWVALGEPSVAIFVPVFPYAGQPPAALDDFFLSVNAKRRLVYDYETDADGYPIDNITVISPYNHLRNYDHSINLAALFGGNYYGEGGLQAYNFAIEEELYKRYEAKMDVWRNLTADKITPTMLADWQEEQSAWAVGEYVKSDPTVATYEAEDGRVCSATTGTKVQLDEYTNGERVDEWAWQMTTTGHLSCAHQFAGHTIVEVVAMGMPDDGQWPKMRVWADGKCLTEVGGETDVDCLMVVSPTNATDKAKDVGEDTIDPNLPRFALYRYRTTLTGTSTITVEAVDATLTRTLSIDKIIVRTEPRSVEMYEVEKDWDAKSDADVEIGEDTILLTSTAGFFEIYHYAWGEPLTIEVAATGFSTNPNSILSLTCESRLVGTATLTTEYAVYAFGWNPGSEGQATCRVQPGNYKDIRVDKLLMKESLPIKPNAAPLGCFAIDLARVAPIGYTPITATAIVTDPDRDAIASYFWDFGDGESYSSGNPVVTHTYEYPKTPSLLTLYATDRRGKTMIIHCCGCRAYLPIVMKNGP